MSFLKYLTKEFDIFIDEIQLFWWNQTRKIVLAWMKKSNMNDMSEKNVNWILKTLIRNNSTL